MAEDAVIIDVPKIFYSGVPTPFSVSTVAGDYAGTMVKAIGEFSADVLFTAWYYETSTGEWVELEGDTFGPQAGFPMADATSQFKVSFDEARSGEFTVHIVKVEDDTVICSSTAQVIVAPGESIDDLDARVKEGGTIDLTTDVVGTINVSKDTVINGNGKTLYGGIVLDASGDDGEYSVVINSLKMVGTATATYGIVGQNQGDKGDVRPVNVAINGCDLTGFSKKAIYITNAKTLVLQDSRIHDNAFEKMDDPNTYGDYAVDVNQCGVQDSLITISGNVFNGYAGKKSAIKVTMRGGVGLTDDVNTDITTTENATIRNLTIEGNVFNISGDAVDITIGSSPNADGTQRSFCIAHPTYISATTVTDVAIRGPTGKDMAITMSPSSALAIESEPSDEGKMKSFVVASRGKVVVSNVFDGADVTAIAEAWVLPDNGPAGMGFMNLKRLVMHMDSLTYGDGIAVPSDFYAEHLLSVSAKGGITGWLDKANNKVILYPTAGNDLVDLTIILLGH